MGGKSKSTTVGYWYEIAFHSGLGIGPIDAYLEFFGGDKTAWKGEATHSQTIQINAPTLWGGEKDQGGIVGSVDLMFGEPTQQPSSRLAGIFGPQQPAWRGLATLVFAGKYGAMNPYPQKASHKIRRILAGWDDECWYPGKAAIPMPTCSGGDPYIHATSLPYTQYVDDSMQIHPVFLSAKLRQVMIEWPQPPESLAVAPGFISASTRPLQWAFNQYPELLAVSPVFIGAGTKLIQVTHSLSPEALATAPSFIGAATKEVLSRNDIPAESLSISTNFLGASTS
ncbi:hypothetical protein [Stenotrophomonas sp. PS02298]|uniref:hypothetical protein n=1 Tax=Stenotrophomonas sp. PS02298 TaxID=2991424 RepID=UPI00249B31B6|nr:hypothetical protein [Stenotrophomonas sp. PS02298]